MASSSSAIDIMIEEDGTLRAIYNDALVPLMEQGEARTARASAVEPVEVGRGWTATMVDGPVLGPFTTRAEALAAEVAWLKTNRNL